MIRRPPRSTQSRSSAASDVYKRQLPTRSAPVSAVHPAPLCSGLARRPLKAVAPVRIRSGLQAKAQVIDLGLLALVRPAREVVDQTSACVNGEVLSMSR